MQFDIRKGSWPLGQHLACVALDAVTGDRVPMVFFYDDESHLVGRYAVNDKGNCYVSPGTRDAAKAWETRQLRFIPKNEYDKMSDADLASLKAASVLAHAIADPCVVICKEAN